MRTLTRLILVIGMLGGMTGGMLGGMTVGFMAGCQKPVDKAENKEAEPGVSPTTQVMQQPPATRGELAPPMDVAAPPEGAVKTESGIFYKVLSEGNGQKPGPNDTALVHYTGWRTNGELFYSTQRRGSPQPMSMVQLAPGWEEALKDMKVGDKRLYWMPPALASRGAVGGDDAFLVFEIELTGIEPAPPVPEDVAAAPADALKTESGVAYKVLEPGTGTDKPRDWDQVTVHYTVWTPEGKMVDSTAIRKRPRPMQLFREPKGWAEVIRTMVTGQKVRAWIPEALLDKRPGAPAGGVTIDFELVDLRKMNNPPPVPKDVAAPPKDAKKTAGGVFYKVLKKGTGTEKPTPDKTVKVNYTGWTTDGKMFDSSIVRGQPAQFPLSGVIPGWTDGLQVMVVGETTRFWIPQELAYEGKAGRPQGMLVFDVELLEIMAAPQHGMMPPGHQPVSTPTEGKPAGVESKPAQQGAAPGHGGAAPAHGTPKPAAGGAAAPAQGGAANPAQ